jgi:hypothetical protein
MVSGALPSALPMSKVAADHFWIGGDTARQIVIGMLEITLMISANSHSNRRSDWSL